VHEEAEEGGEVEWEVDVLPLDEGGDDERGVLGKANT
jgi:hypothetical protein